MTDIFDCMIRASMKTVERLNAGGPGSGPQGGGGGGSEGSSGSGSSGSGSSGSSSSASKSHSVKLPKSKTKITISQTSKALDQMGFKLGPGAAALVGGKFVTSFKVTMPDGSTQSMTTDSLKDLVYSGAGK